MSRIQASNLRDELGHFARDAFQSAFDFAPVGLAICGRDGRLLFVNHCLCTILGFERAELMAQPWANYICMAAGKSGPDVLPERQVWSFARQETSLLGRDGRRIRAHVTMHPVLDEHAAIDHLIVTVSRIEDVDECRELSRFDRHYDTLTELPNRRLLERRLRQILLAAADHAQPVGVLSVGMDHFDTVNDSMGRHVGNSMLRYVAKLLMQTVDGRGSVVRTGGDHFIVILPGLDTESVAAQATAIDACLSRSYEIDGYLVRPSVRIGMAVSRGQRNTFS